MNTTIGLTSDSRIRQCTTPAAVWAALGAAALIAQCVLLGRWLAEDGMHAAVHDYVISTTRIAPVWIEQAAMAIGLVAVAAVLWWQYRQTRTVTLYAIAFWGNFCTWWLSPIMAYHYPSPISNRYALNVVSWGHHIPGWHPNLPGSHIETLLAAQMFMFPLVVSWVWLQSLCLSVVRRQWPHWGSARILAVLVVSGFLVDLVVELLFVSVCGAYAYPLANHSLSLFGGHWYQIPLPNVLIGGLLLCTPTTFMAYRAQQRGSVPHIFRGTEHLTSHTQAAVRVAAGIGYANVIMFVYVVLVACVPLLGTGPVPADTPGWIWPGR
ncbi:spirocyclase AveC family protein [Nocardia ninae]|uniref:DUF5135 domain-containing protein n=1 Tax=Nocardia ninae NBRC 108245 TaxID=1210091 RepID=A0A511MIM4_9NOCA|nr:spirocyclase AveC family protein [Nocardia ninae]GEM39958.1 hypothetical protein NN4_44770 [Nocardia ninae NBRC 108245]